MIVRKKQPADNYHIYISSDGYGSVQATGRVMPCLSLQIGKPAKTLPKTNLHLCPWMKPGENMEKLSQSRGGRDRRRS